ncbi:hypothetical protein NDU88_006150 [Pleurodeles waltl]|uniref:Uncharacterized protein n=1 Tax=Pleurodeles waltl TaxID=8319 RepID=A0AAV7TYP2_PLEWA|nr:hypothetical protein NDU88_006150 [Pleurodeles waltl]
MAACADASLRALTPVLFQQHSDPRFPLIRVPLNRGERREGVAARKKGRAGARRRVGTAEPGPPGPGLRLLSAGTEFSGAGPVERPSSWRRTEGPGGVRWSAGSSGWRRQAEEVRAWRPRR